MYTINSALLYIHEQKYEKRNEIKKNYIIHGDLRP